MDYKNTVEFQNAKFGMFIHWGLYAVPAGRWKGKSMDYVGEWIQSKFRIPNSEYTELAKQFNPDCFNADEWVKCAKNAGMAYIVFTAKHHDGFAMYHSRVSRFNVVDATPWGRDVLRELAYACRRHGMKLGIYYSHCLDWRESDAGDPGSDSRKNFGMSWGNDWDFPDHANKNFNAYFHRKALPQIRELLTEYGPVFLLWFDCPVQITLEQATELRDLVHELQPDCLIGNRIGHDLGDFGCLGDNQSPAGRSKIPLESANTINHTWGYKKDDHCWAGAAKIINDLLACSEKNVNYLLNVGPRADGRLPEASIDILEEIADWREQNKVIVQGVEGNPFPQAFPWGYCTVKGRILQFFVTENQRSISISGLRSRIKSCNVPFSQEGKKLCIELPEERKDNLPLVILAECMDEPEFEAYPSPQDGVLMLSPSQGEILAGNSAEQWDIDVKLEPDGERMRAEDSCRLAVSGALTQWHHQGDGICWDIAINEAGTYEFRLLTENRKHSAAWTGARTVRIEFAGQILENRLENDEVLSSSYYHKSASVIGSMKLNGTERGRLHVLNCSIESPEAIDMNLTAVKICRQEGVLQL